MCKDKKLPYINDHAIRFSQIADIGHIGKLCSCEIIAQSMFRLCYT